MAGRTSASVAAEFGFEESDMVKLASNEWYEGPLAPVQAVIGSAAAEVHRYPDNSVAELSGRLADTMGIAPDNLWFGAGSSSTLREMALAVGGPGTSAVFAYPSFAIYSIATHLAGAEGRRVPLDSNHRLDLGAMLDAIDETTTIVYVCSPNNPTGTVNAAEETLRFIDAVPETVLVIIDEAYGEFVTDDTWASMVTEAVRRPNVVVTRTFSKIYGLAALRIGYAVGMPDTLVSLRRAQAPFTVTTVAQAAAVASLALPDLVKERQLINEAGRHGLQAGLADRAIDVVPSQANFVYIPTPNANGWFDALQREGVITRSMPAGLRVTVGTDAEHERFFASLDRAVLA